MLPKIQVPNWAPFINTLDQTVLRARVQRRAFWLARYRDRDDVAEWQCDWSILPRKGLKELRLICPDGQVAVLGSEGEASDRLFQLKGAVATVGAGRGTLYQLIGMLKGTNGLAQCWAWEYETRRLVGPFFEKVEPGQFQYQNIGTLAFDVIGIKPD